MGEVPGVPPDNAWPPDIDAVYAAVGDDRAFRDALGSLGRRLNARAVLMATVSIGRDGPCRHLVSVGAPPESLVEYENHFHAHDTWVRYARAKGLIRTGTVATSDEIVSRGELERSYFWRAFLSRYDTTETLSSALETMEDAGAFTFLSFHRGELQPRFTSREKTLLVQWLPHLRNALHLHRRLAPQVVLGKTLQQLFDEAGSPMVILDGRGHLVRHNPAWDAWSAHHAGHVRTEAQGELALRDRSAWRGMAAVLRPLLQQRATPGTLRVPLGRSHLMMLRRIEHGPAATGAPAADQVIGIVEVSDDHRPESLRERFGLTPAQARVAMALAAGQSPADAALALGISLPTVRTHITALYAKTGCRRLPALVATLLRREA